MNIAGYEHDVVLLADYLKVKADADRLAEALRFYATSKWNDDYPGGITTKQPNGTYLDTGQIARAALAAHEELDGRA